MIWDPKLCPPSGQMLKRKRGLGYLEHIHARSALPCSYAGILVSARTPPQTCFHTQVDPNNEPQDYLKDHAQDAFLPTASSSSVRPPLPNGDLFPSLIIR